jgi:hypothetical protein
MKPVQKLILVLFAFVDLAVIGGLALTVFRASRESLPQEVAFAAPPSACIAGLIEAYSGEGSSARVDWREEGASASHATVDIVLAAEALPAPPTPQLVWDLLDRLSPALHDLCDFPSTVILRVTVSGTTGTSYYAIETPGEQLAGWLRGELDDAELAVHARYRESVSLAP